MLTEGFREVSRIDLMHSEARRLPRPTVRAFLQESRRLAAAVAAETGAGAIFNGGGGDNVFCSLRSSGPAADRLLTAGPGAEFLRTARAIGELAPASLWAVVSDAVRRAWLGKPALREVRDSALLSPRALEQAGAMEAHPWLDLPARALPGKAMHVRLLAFAQSFVEGFDPQDALPTVAPLLAQPLVEACLSVPSWSWFAEGRDRVIARRAFAGGLPVEILQRRSKGTPDSFVAEIFEKYRATLRAMLADGALAAHDMLDLPKVLRALDDPRPVHGDAFRRILQFVDAEAWAAEQHVIGQEHSCRRALAGRPAIEPHLPVRPSLPAQEPELASHRVPPEAGKASIAARRRTDPAPAGAVDRDKPQRAERRGGAAFGPGAPAIRRNRRRSNRAARLILHRHERPLVRGCR
jgi:asparagine synthase (glutamine-hydrolysing)